MKKEFSKREVLDYLEEYRVHSWKKGAAINQLDKFLKSKGLLDEELEKGVWYKSLTIFDQADALVVYDGTGYGYGFNYQGNWDNSIAFHEEGATKATKEEIEPLLIAEAKRRGLVEGVEVKCLSFSKDDSVTIKRKYYMGTHSDFQLWTSSSDYGICIYRRGKWATPITKTELTIERIQEKLGYKIKIVE